MGVSTRVSGSIITWTASACTHGRMADNIAASTKMTRSTAMASIHGPMAELTQDTGAVVNSTGSAPTTCQANQPSSASGKKAKE